MHPAHEACYDRGIIPTTGVNPVGVPFYALFSLSGRMFLTDGAEGVLNHCTTQEHQLLYRWNFNHGGLLHHRKAMRYRYVVHRAARSLLSKICFGVRFSQRVLASSEEGASKTKMVVIPLPTVSCAHLCCGLILNVVLPHTRHPTTEISKHHAWYSSTSFAYYILGRHGNILRTKNQPYGQGRLQTRLKTAIADIFHTSDRSQSIFF